MVFFNVSDPGIFCLVFSFLSQKQHQIEAPEIVISIDYCPDLLALNGAHPVDGI
jgi:hypothetical protein